jgi:CheY-like chemotaxis protein
MSYAVTFDPIYLATRRGDEDALLVLAGERLAAILVRISPEDNEAGETGWWLESGFGPCQMEGLVFPTLMAAEAWVRERLQQGWGDDWASASRPNPSVRRGQPQTREPSSRSLRILIVEDDAVHALDLEAHLHRLGHQVVDTVATASEAVAAAAEHRPDLVFMDVRLADGTDGIRAAVEIQSRLSIPAIFVTGHTDPRTQARIEQARPLELLAKPVSPAAITAALKRAAELPRTGHRPS